MISQPTDRALIPADRHPTGRIESREQVVDAGSLLLADLTRRVGCPAEVLDRGFLPGEIETVRYEKL